MARLLGYRWPDQEPDELDALADADGIVPIPSVRGEPPAAERLREVLKAAFGAGWSASREHTLLTEAGARPGDTLDDWLRNQFFEQHCKLFHQRPFIWHLWDGRKDGFSCLVNYHKLDAHAARQPDPLLPRGLDQPPGRRRPQQQARCRPPAGRRPGVPGEAQAHPRGRAALRHLRPLEAPLRAADRLEPRPQRRRPDEHPPLPHRRDPAEEAEHQVDQGPGKEPQRPREEYPWFWDGETFKGDRVNDRHFTNAEKQAARDRAGVEAKAGGPKAS